MGSLGYLHILIIMNNITRNIRVQVSLWDPDFISFEYIPEVGLLDHKIILRNHHTVFHSDYKFTFPPVHKSLLFSISSPTLVISCVLDASHSNRCEVLFHLVLISISLIISHVDHLGHLYTFFVHGILQARIL